MKKIIIFICGLLLLVSGCGKSVVKKNDEVIIKIDTISSVDNGFKKAIAVYEQEHPNVTIQLNENTAYGDIELKRTQMFSALSSGDGPDIIYCDSSSMEYFSEKNCLLELNDVLTDETKQQYLSGVILSGEYNDICYMLPMHLNLSAIYVNNDVFAGNHWSVSDVVNIIKEKEEEDNPFEDIWLMYEEHQRPEELLMYFFMADVMHSEFLDLEKGVCDFQSDLFRDVLEICKKYGVQSEGSYPCSREERAKKLCDKNIMSFSEPLINFSKFSLLEALIGEEANLIGVPTLSKSGIQLTSVSGLCVNRTTKQKEAVIDFLDCLFNQQYYQTNPVDQIPIRKNCLEGKVQEDADWTDDVIVWIGAGLSTKVASKETGESFEKEYIEFLDRCIPYDENNTFIINIITEEAGPYFFGDKDLETVCSLIQNRVQLYLDEK